MTTEDVVLACLIVAAGTGLGVLIVAIVLIIRRP